MVISIKPLNTIWLTDKALYVQIFVRFGVDVVILFRD
jgi:hypothetical protein